MKFVTRLAVAVACCCIGGVSQPAAPTFDEISRQAMDALDSRPEQAVALFQQGLKLKPDWVEGWQYLGASLYQLNRYGEARDAFRKAIPLAPQNGTAWSFLGLCEFQAGDSAHALEAILKGEELGMAASPDFVAAVRIRAALIFIHDSHFEQAAAQLEPLAKDGNKAPAAIEAAGLATLGIAKPVAELTDDKKAMVHLAGQAAWALAAQHPAEAESAFRELIAKYPNEPAVPFTYGVFLLDRDPDEALRQFQKELQIDPQDVRAGLQIAFLQLKRGSPELAVQPAREVLKVQPSNVFGHLALGRALLAMTQTKLAIAELESAVKLAPENPQTHFYLEQAYRRAGRTADAQKQKAEFARLKAKQDPLSLPNQPASQ